jgi:hypothetical protein
MIHEGDRWPARDRRIGLNKNTPKKILFLG